MAFLVLTTKGLYHRTRIFHPRLGAPPLIRSGPFLWGFVAPSDLITHTNFEMILLRNLGVAEGQNFVFSITSADALNMACLGGQPVIIFFKKVFIGFCVDRVKTELKCGFIKHHG